MHWPGQRAQTRYMRAITLLAYAVMMGGMIAFEASALFWNHKLPDSWDFLVEFIKLAGLGVGVIIVGAAAYIGYILLGMGSEVARLAVLRRWLRLTGRWLIVLETEPPEMRAWCDATLLRRYRVHRATFSGRCPVSFRDGRDATMFKIRFY